MSAKKISKSAQDSPPKNMVSGLPTKPFFVRMLVRDIELEDAVLDLLDNCIDGVVRTNLKKTPANKDQPYKGFHAAITMKRDRFEISDNCGGIPRQVAIKSAFRLGRLPEEIANLPTVGLYGIGMKRAIFKLADSAYVESRHGNSNFRVDFSEEWLQNDDDWYLPLKKARRTRSGTTVVVDKLKPEIGERFDAGSNFVDDFKKFVAAHYSLIIHKGFEVKVNGDVIKPEPFKLLTAAATAFADGTGLAPYCFRGIVDDVHIELYAGLYRNLPSETELDEEQSSRGSSDDAGWSVACNDRIVVNRDKTRLTGWGDGGVPRYHGQFIAISGLVLLTSDTPEKLPLTTTKRGLEASTNVYLVVREQMQLATKYFTSFTNRWKGKIDELEAIYRDSSPRTVDQLRSMLKKVSYSQVRKVAGAERFEPSLPQPKPEDRGQRITFYRPKDKANKLGKVLFGDEDWDYEQLGGACFDSLYTKHLGRRG